MPETPLPLSHLKVLDLTRVRGGPACVRQLADWGADVIRIETPPGMSGDDGYTGKRHSSDFQNLHRNKRSMTLNLKSDAAKKIFAELVGQPIHFSRAPFAIRSATPEQGEHTDAVLAELGYDAAAIAKLHDDKAV